MKIFIALSFFLNINIWCLEKCGLVLSELDYDRDRSNCTSIEMQNIHLSPEGNFYIHYDNYPRFDDSGELIDDHSPDLTDIEPLDGVPDYINLVAEVADSSYKLLIDKMRFKNGSNGDDNITDIYVLDMGGSFYGRAIRIGCDDSCIEIDNDYEDDSYIVKGIDAMKVTTLHEFFHVVQFDYRCGTGGDGYFYELSSTWIEDLGYPDINDYLNFLNSNSSSNYYKNPSIDFDDTNGYSLALFGHYLSTQFEQDVSISYESELDSKIMNRIWGRMSTGNISAISSVDYILDSLGSSFADAWLDFNIKNLYNQIDESMYYYEDQALITKINIDPVLVDNSLISESIDLNNKSIYLSHYEVFDTSKLNLSFDIEINELNGNILTFYNNNYISSPLFNGFSDLLFPDKNIYIIVNSDQNNVNLNINVEPFYVPQGMNELNALVDSNFVKIYWEFPSNKSEDLEFEIYRDNVFIETIDDSLYYDQNIESNTTYVFSVVAKNQIGRASPISISINTSMPDFPFKPDFYNFFVDNDKVQIWWAHSAGIGEISYVVYRDGDSIYSTIDTIFYDYNIENNKNYNYSIYSLNEVGLSDDAINFEVETWPSSSDISRNIIINSFPNPLDINNVNYIGLILDVVEQRSDINSKITLFDIRGREIRNWNNLNLSPGRQRVILDDVQFLPISSGIYYLSFRNNSIPIVIKN
tara:strand:+ start:2271 stop:4361 length:2091 start_codon:yes stop_codon:yes gene_type:complete